MTDNFVPKTTTKSFFHQKYSFRLVMEVNKAIPLIEEVRILQELNFVTIVFWELINVIQVRTVGSFLLDHVFKDRESNSR